MVKKEGPLFEWILFLWILFLWIQTYRGDFFRCSMSYECHSHKCLLFVFFMSSQCLMKNNQHAILMKQHNRV